MSVIEQVRAAWAEVLDTDPDAIALDLNFFDAGGDSVLLVVLLERLNELTERTLEPPDLFRHSTVLAQAALLTSPDTAAPAASPVPDRRALLGRAARSEPTDA